MLAFTIAHVSVIALRFREPDRPRGLRGSPVVPVRGARVPLPAVLGAMLAAAGWLSVLVFHAGARYVGGGWLIGGLVLYTTYRKTQDKPLLRRVTIPDRALRHETLEPEFGSILVPIFGNPLDDDIIQTAARLAGSEHDDLETAGAVIEAIWVFEVPMALPLEASLPEAQVRRARDALARAKEVGEEYEGVTVATALVRARRVGQGIVSEARRRGVEAIVLAAEEPSRVRGGGRLGGPGGPLDNYLGDVTKYVIRKAPCRVILTAAPAERRAIELGSRPDRDWLESQPMFILIVGAGRVGSAVAKRALEAGHEVSVLDSDPLSHERLDTDATPHLGGRRRALHGRHGARGRRSDRGRDRGSRRFPGRHQGRQYEPGDRPDRAAPLQRAASGRPRRRPGPGGLVRRAGSAHDLPDAAGDRHGGGGRAGAVRRMDPTMYVIIAGAGKVGWNLARELIAKDQEVTLIESDHRRYRVVEEELEHAVQYGDATELWVLERAGIQRADLVIAVTGDDEDNILICQVAKEKYECQRIVARVNNPRNLQHFKLLGIQPAVSATDLILRLIEHEVPEYGLVQLLALEEERLEIIELEVAEGSPAAGRRVAEVPLPDGSLIISVLRGGAGFVPKADSVIEAGDQVLLILDPGLEAEITPQFAPAGAAAAADGRGRG